MAGSSPIVLGSAPDMVEGLTAGNLIVRFAVAAGLSAAATWVLIIALHPLLVRYALARPNARSSHTVPTPQGAGIALVAGMVTAGAVCMMGPIIPDAPWSHLALIASAVVFIGVVGAVDDIHPLPVVPRLIAQGLAIIVILYAFPGDMRIFPTLLPTLVERALLFVGSLWFVNLCNFMDGIDWITVTEFAPLMGALTLFSIIGAASPVSGFIAALAFGGIIGFAPFNRPTARLFLGDVGSLPLGLIGAGLLIHLAASGNIVAAILLPLYYAADATITLIWRLSRRERIWEAHRSHFYQVALNRGLSVHQILGRIFSVNLILCALALASVAATTLFWNIVLLILGGACVAWLLHELSRDHRAP